MKQFLNQLSTLLSKDQLFFNRANEGKRITHIALAIPLIIVFFIAGALVSQVLIYQVFLKSLNLSEDFKQIYELIIGFSSTTLFLWLWIRFFEKRPFWTIGFPKKEVFRNYLKGFISGILMITTVLLILFILGRVEVNPQSALQFTPNLFILIFIYLIGFMIQGATEEILARGWQMQVIGKRHNPTIAVIITSVIFALLHGMNKGISLIALFNLLLFAFLLATYVLKYNSLWAACGWHAAWNWVISCIYGLNVSGQRINTTLFKIDLNGPKYITGGEFGPEASIITTVVLFISIISLVYFNKEKKTEPIQTV